MIPSVVPGRLAVAACGLALASWATGAEPPPVTLEDYGAVKNVGAPRISPDGRLVAYTLDSRVHVVPVAGGTARAVTSEASAASSPRWSDDGSALYFLSDRGGTSQLWKLPVDTFGEAGKLTDFERGVDTLNLSPDQSALLLRLPDEKPEPDKSDEKEPWVIDRRQFKEDAGDGYLTERPTDHLYRYDVAAGELAPITSGDKTEDDAAWSPDGKTIVFVSNREPDPDVSYRTDLWTIPADAGGDMSALTRLTNSERVVRAPAFSPDGRWLAWLSAEDGVYGIYELAIMPAEGGEPRILSTALDRWISDFRFSADSRFVYVVFENHGGAHLARIRVRDGRLERLVEGDQHVSAFDVDARGNLVVRMSNRNDAANLYARRGESLEALTAVNDEFLASRSLGDKSKVSYTVGDGTVVEAFVTTPPGYVEGRRYPAILKIHGGPVGQFAWGYDVTTQLLAASGYVVLEPNPRGSTGRGQEFVRAIYRSWGITDYPDIVGAVDHAVGLGLVDPERVAVTGYSYGGYMTNVVITESDRFCAAASGAGHSHIVANYGHDIYQKWYNWEIGPPTEDNRATYDRLSPLLRAERVTTPTIFLGGREDWNVPILSSELFYQTLKSRGIDTRLVVYPDSHHAGWEERFAKDYRQRIIGWFGRYCGSD